MEYTMKKILEDLVERANDYIKEGEEKEEAIFSAIDDGMLYTDDQWTAYRYYCEMGDPEDKMWDALFEDVYKKMEGGDK